MVRIKFLQQKRKEKTCWALRTGSGQNKRRLKRTKEGKDCIREDVIKDLQLLFSVSAAALHREEEDSVKLG